MLEGLTRCRMAEDVPNLVSCRVCARAVARDAHHCPGCGANEPWIPDEPTMNPRVIRAAMWGGGAVLVVLLLLVIGLVMFGPRAEEEERDHRPPAPTQQSR